MVEEFNLRFKARISRDIELGFVVPFASPFHVSQADICLGLGPCEYLIHRTTR